MATSCAEGVHTRLSVPHRRATHIHAFSAATQPHFRPKLSPLSQSRAARVMEELRPLNRSQPFRNLPPCGWYFVMATPPPFGQLSPIQSTSSPTDSWHVDSEMAK